MMVDGKWLDNITCKRCRRRHPAEISCARAKEIAAQAAKERDEQSNLASEDDAKAFIAALRTVLLHYHFGQFALGTTPHGWLDELVAEDLRTFLDIADRLYGDGVDEQI